MKRWTWWAALALAGCGGDSKDAGYKRDTVPLNDVPENIRKIAKDDLKATELMDAMKKSKKSDGSFVSYEVRAKDPKTGKIREVGVAPDGKILERE
jgi:hypothetical protein